MTNKKIKFNKFIITISIVCVIIECIFNSVSYASTSLSSAYNSVKKSNKQNEWKLVYADSEGNGTGANWFDSPGWYVVMYDSGVGLQDDMLVLKYKQTSKSKSNGSNAYDLYAVGNNGYDTPVNSSAYSGDIKNANIPRTAVLSDTSKTYTVANYDEIDANGAKSIDQEVGNKETPKTKTTTKVVNESEVKPEWTLQSEKYTYNNDGKYYKKYIDNDGNVYLVDTGEKVKNNESIYEAEDLRTNGDSGTTEDTSGSLGSGISTIRTGPINQDAGMNTMISMVFGVVQFICIAAAIIVMIITGVRYMIVAPEQKADIKKQSVVLVVGAVIVFAIATILKIIANLTRTSIN